MIKFLGNTLTGFQIHNAFAWMVTVNFQHPCMFKKDGNLKAEYVKANEMINRCERDALFMQYMSGEKQVIMRLCSTAITCISASFSFETAAIKNGSFFPVLISTTF